MPTFNSADFRREVAESFRAALKRKGITKTQAADDLGISRQAFYKYLSAQTAPKGPVLQRACQIWGITLNYRGLVIAETSFPKARIKKESTPVQQLLFDALKSLSDENLEIKILRRRAKSVLLSIEIRFAN
jgi:transcriptional regulator with XRE-family HTH domain